MGKFEYKEFVVNKTNRKTGMKELNELGADGWEVVDIKIFWLFIAIVYTMKRKLRE